LKKEQAGGGGREEETVQERDSRQTAVLTNVLGGKKENKIYEEERGKVEQKDWGGGRARVEKKVDTPSKYRKAKAHKDLPQEGAKKQSGTGSYCPHGGYSEKSVDAWRMVLGRQFLYGPQ